MRGVFNPEPALSSACDFKGHFANNVDPYQTAPPGAV